MGIAVLLIPDDPAALVLGPCGMRPPMMIRGPDKDAGAPSEWVPLEAEWGDPLDYMGTRCTLALTLAFDGVVLPAGCLFALPIEEHGHAFLHLIGLVRAVLVGSSARPKVEGWTLEVVGEAGVRPATQGPSWAIGNTSGRLTLYVDNDQVAEVWKDDSHFAGMWSAALLEPWAGDDGEYWTESGALDAVIGWGKARGVKVPKCPVEFRTEKPPYPLPA